MSTPLQPVITKAGLGAIWRQDHTGLAAEITHVVVGTAGYTPLNTQTALRAQVAKFPISDGEKLSETLLHVTALADGPLAVWVREIGFLLADGTLLCVWSHPTEVLAYKPAGADLLLAYDLSLTALPPGSVTITSTGAGLNLTLSEELAALASASIADMLRGMRQQDALDSQEKVDLVVGQQITNLMGRMKAAEQRQDSDYEGMVTVSAALAAGEFSEMLRGAKAQDVLEEQATLNKIEGQQIADLTCRMKAAEGRQDSDQNNLLIAVTANAAAVISLQTLFVKSTYGA